MNRNLLGLDAREVLDSMGEPVILLDPDMKPVYVNEAFRGRFAAPDLGTLQVMRAERSEELKKEQAVVYASNGHWGHMELTELRDSNGLKKGFIGLCKDSGLMGTLQSCYEEYWAEKAGRTLWDCDKADGTRYSSLGTVKGYEANLTADRIIRLPSEWTGVLGLEAGASYTDLIRTTARMFFTDAYAASFLRKKSREELLEAYGQGLAEVSCEYQITAADGTNFWIDSAGYMTQGGEGGDVRLFVFAKDIGHKKREELRLRKTARLDRLTGLYNRGESIARIKEALLQNCHRRCALMMVDLDNFKEVNDTFGHIYGDQVLETVSGIIREQFRPDDVIGRLGGDEFIIFTENGQDTEAVVEIAQNVCDSLKTSYTDGKKQVEMSASLGIAFFPDHGKNFDMLYARADVALYQVKKRGKRGVCVFQDER